MGLTSLGSIALHNHYYKVIVKCHDEASIGNQEIAMDCSRSLSIMYSLKAKDEKGPDA